MADISQEAPVIELDHVTILRDCYLTAKYCDNVHRRLQGLSISIRLTGGHAPDSLLNVARCLTKPADVAQLHSGQIQVVLLNLSFILPCLAQLLLNIESPLAALIRAQQNFRPDCNVGAIRVPGPCMLFGVIDKYLGLLLNVLFTSASPLTPRYAAASDGLIWLVKADHFFRMPTISDARQMQEAVLEIIRMHASHGISEFSLLNYLPFYRSALLLCLLESF